MNERQIFEGAIEFRNPVDRRAFLDKACGGDVALRASVEALLAAHDAASQFLNVPAVEQLQGGTGKGLDRTLDHSVAKPNDEMDIDDGTDGPDLSFLQPANKPGSIGSLGHYEILQILGQGAFGVVFRAFDEKLHRQVAVKAMNPQLAATSPPRKRFLREARSVAAIKHENIVQIYSVEEQPLPFLVMEFVQGQTLQQKLDGNGPLDVPEILHLGRQMAAGLAAAHALNMIHRDVKPGNILLEQGAEQKVKITDFGLARAADDASMTRTGVIAGTPMYMSPEQAEGRTLDARSDLFSLGSVLYQMATGRPPFRAPNTIAVLRRVVEDTPRPMSEIIADLPPWLETIVLKLLEKDPEKRFQSAKEVAELFARCQNELQLHGKVTCVTATSQAAALPSEPAVTIAAHESSAKPNRWLVAVPALLVVFLLGMYLINRAVDQFYPAVPANAPDGKPTQVSNAPAIQKFTSGEWIDVIPLIEPQKDKWNVAKQTGQNAWRIEQGELVVGGDALASKLLVPLDSDWPAYECELEFTRRAGENGLNVNLPTSNGECPVIFDPPGFAGVHLGNRQQGKELQAGKQIVTDQRTTLRVEVHRSPKNDRVSVTVNGAGPWDWTGDLNALALVYRENFPQDRRISLFVHRGGDFVFHRIRVRMLDGGLASTLRPLLPVAPTLVADAPKAYALQFDGIDDRVDVPPLNLPKDAPLTIEAVMEFEARQHWGVIFTTHGMALTVQAGQLNFGGAYRGGLPSPWVRSPDPLHLRQPVHVAGVRDGAHMRLFVDGKLVDQNEHGALIMIRPATTTIGDHSAEVQHPLHGKMQLLRVSSSARYDAEFTPPASYETDEHTLALYRFDEGTGNLLKDHSGLGRDGQIVGSSWTRLASRKQPTGWHGWPADAPKPAIAPFNAEQAKKHQLDWADYLKVPVEWENSIGMKFRLIPPGEFMMGSTADEIAAALKEMENPNDQEWRKHWEECVKSESPRHRVILTQPTYLSIQEVTQADFEKTMGSNPALFKEKALHMRKVVGLDTSKHPVEGVSWSDASEFCAQLSQQEKLKPWYFRAGESVTRLSGTGYQLPTEAQWEFACRAGTTTKFWFGDQSTDLAKASWFASNSGDRPHHVGELQSNFFGLFDVHGNVSEWVQDDWEPNSYSQFATKLAIDPERPPTSGPRRVIRGGAWDSSAYQCRSAFRNSPDTLSTFSIGFRVSLPVDAVRQLLNLKAPAITAETLEKYFARNRQAAERALTLGGEVTVEITKPVEWRTLKAGDSLPVEPFVLRMWSIKNSPTATNADLDVLAGLRHVLQLNVMTKSKLDAEIIPKIAALQSPVKELGLGHLQLKTSELDQLPVMPNVHVLWLSSEQVDDGWKFLRRFPGLRTLELYGAPLPDLSPLGDVPQLRTLRLTACGELPADAKVRDVPTRNPQLRILYDSAGEQKVLGTDPARIAARRLIEAGIPVDVVAADGARKNLPLAEVEQTVTNQHIVLAIPRGVELTDELRALLTHMSLQNFKAEGLRKADSLAQLLKDRQDIEHLDLTGSDLTDAGLVLLSRIAGMRGLYLNGTPVTAAGTAAFHRAVPGCFIHSDTGNIDADYAANPLAAPADRAASWQGWPADAPAPAIAPFNAEHAKKHQKEWADYLKVPVEHENSVGMKFVLIPPGEFLMGSTPAEIADTLPAVEGKGQQWLDGVRSEAPQHRVILTRPFYLGVTEVTQAGYEKIMGLRPSLFAKTAADKKYLEKIKDSDTSLHPVESVSWNDAAEFCAKLSELEKWKPSYFRSGQVVTLLDGNGYRLPSEAEWEFAARSGTTSRYSAGDKEEHLLEAGWFAGNAGEVTHAVQKLKGNPFGLYDMHGNVWEWVQDAWKADYYGQFAEKPALDPSGASLANPLRVARGGGWSAPACGCRSAFRTIPNTTFQREDFGLRIALSVDAVRSALKQTGSATALPAVNLTPP